MTPFSSSSQGKQEHLPWSHGRPVPAECSSSKTAWPGLSANLPFHLHESQMSLICPVPPSPPCLQHLQKPGNRSDLSVQLATVFKMSKYLKT